VKRAFALFLAAPLLFSAGRAEARGCRERSKIVGKTRCSRFGDGWDVENKAAFVVGIGPSISSIPLRGVSFDSALAQRTGNGPTLRTYGSGLGAWTAVGPALRLSFFVPRVVYVGAEGSFGGAFARSSDTAPTAADGTRPLPQYAMHASSGMVASLGSIVGASIPAWRFDLSAELFSGFRALNPDLAWRSSAAANAAAGGCWDDPKYGVTCPSLDTGTTVVGRVEPRGGLALRLTPWITLRGLGGYDLVGHGWSATSLFEFHSRVYDGFHARRTRAE
jgi:hypothetical protein